MSIDKTEHVKTVATDTLETFELVASKSSDMPGPFNNISTIVLSVSM